MTISEPALDAWLAASRRLVPNDQLSPMDSYYRETYDKVRSFVKGDLPELVVVYSTERSCEVIKAGQKWYLIYDRYLGETFAVLSRILYHSEKPDYAEAFALKCIAQRLASMGKLPQAYHVAACYYLFHPKEHLTKQDRDTDRAKLTWAQEIFVMAHEVCHHRLKHDQNFHAIHRVNAEMVYAQGRELALRKPKYTLRRKLNKQYGFPANDKYWATAMRKREELWDANKDKIIEEIVCDSFALAVLLAAGPKKSDAFASLCFRSAFLTVRYLRVLSYCNAFAQCIATGSFVFPINELSIQTQMREQCLFATFTAAYDNYTSVDERDEYNQFLSIPFGRHLVIGLPDKIDSQINAYRNHLNDRLIDPITFRLPTLINGIRKELDLRTAPKEGGGEASDEEIFQIIDDLTATNW